MIWDHFSIHNQTKLCYSIWLKSDFVLELCWLLDYRVVSGCYCFAANIFFCSKENPAFYSLVFFCFCFRKLQLHPLRSQRTQIFSWVHHMVLHWSGNLDHWGYPRIVFDNNAWFLFFSASFVHNSINCTFGEPVQQLNFCFLRFTEDMCVCVCLQDKIIALTKFQSELG